MGGDSVGRYCGLLQSAMGCLIVMGAP